ncbi:MAG: 3-keto-5-aminohexanoate cleavage protein [Thermodesulfobacteriota bacterium]
MKQEKKARKVILAVAPVGRDIIPPSMNPLTPESVAREVIRCAEAGAGMVHLHVRDQKGKLTADLTDFSKTVDLIRKSSDIVIQGSTGGLSTLTLEERCTALNDKRVEVASLNMGSVNFGDEVYINTLSDIRYWVKRMKKAKVVPEIEIFEVGMIPAAQKIMEERVLTPPYHYNFCLGFRWAMPADAGGLFSLTSRIPKGSLWGLVHDKMSDLSLLGVALGMGAGIVRVGFEDSVRYSTNAVARKNVELVARLASMIRFMGLEVASPDDARKMMGIHRRKSRS